MSSDNSLFLGRLDGRTLQDVAAAAFAALGVSDVEERHSSNHPPDDHYFVAYASNVSFEICDMDDVKEGFPFLLTLGEPNSRRGIARAPRSIEEVAGILSRAGLKAFRPIGSWGRVDWDGKGDLYAV